jgi:hypothetical protein
MPLFLSAARPVATCTAGACEDCPVRHRLACHFGPGQLLTFLLVAAPAFVLGGIGIARLSAWCLIPWAVVILGCFGLVEIRVLCTHCPHYAEPGTSSLRCWANYGSPKLWRYRPGPMSRLEKTVFLAALGAVAGYPLAFLVAGAQWLLLAGFFVCLAALGALMAVRMCSRCMNFACPFNRVQGPVRQAFLERNPSVARVWAAAARH